MSKILAATLSGGKVLAEGAELAEAVVLSEGVGDSEGVVLLEEDNQTYIAKTTPDLKTTLEKVIAALNKSVSIFNAIGAGMTGPTTAPPPTLAADVMEITQAATDLETLKGNLK